MAESSNAFVSIVLPTYKRARVLPHAISRIRARASCETDEAMALALLRLLRLEVALWVNAYPLSRHRWLSSWPESFHIESAGATPYQAPILVSK